MSVEVFLPSVVFSFASEKTTDGVDFSCKRRRASHSSSSRPTHWLIWSLLSSSRRCWLAFSARLSPAAASARGGLLNSGVWKTLIF